MRIHVERFIGQLKEFRIVQGAVPIIQVDLIDHMIIVAVVMYLNINIFFN